MLKSRFFSGLGEDSRDFFTYSFNKSNYFFKINVFLVHICTLVKRLPAIYEKDPTVIFMYLHI